MDFYIEAAGSFIDEGASALSGKMIKNKLYRRIIGLANYIQELGGYDYYNKASIDAINDYKTFIQYLKDNFDKIDDIYYTKLYRLINIHIIPNIRYIQRTETKNIPWSLISNLDEILKNELGDDCWLLFRPQWHFNYSVNTEDLVTYLKDILLIFFPDDEGNISNSFSNKNIHFFSFPLLEKTNVLLNSVIGHEIGHFYHRKWEESDYKFIREEANKALTKHYDGLPPDDFMKPYKKTAEGLSILDGMYREIISDIYGYYLFGPSIIFALYDITEFEVKQMLPSKENRYYPSLKYRIRILRNRLLKNDAGVDILLKNKENDCSIYLKKFLNIIDNYLLDTDDIELFTTKRKREMDFFESSLDTIIPKIKTSIKNDYLKYENTHELFEKLKNNLPINELKDIPIDIMQIIFTGWLFYKKINEEHSGDGYIIKYQILMRILLKSLHSSFVHKKYREEKGT
jgi:hypothetical protein